jgi:hypothetical protein
MAYIQSATYGDEKTQRDATKVLRDKVSGSSLDIDVNEKLIPPFEVTQKVEITDLEEKKIREDASRACGGADQECVARTEAKLRQEKLKEKQTSLDTAEAEIKGRRLTVIYIDATGKKVRKVIPDGQKFTLDNVTGGDPKKTLPSVDEVQQKFRTLGLTVLYTLLYVFSVAATYVLFSQKTRFGLAAAVPATVVAVFIPFSGYFMIFLYFMFFSAVDTFIGKVQ